MLLNHHFPKYYISFNVWTRYFAWNCKGYLWNSTQNILPKHWKIRMLYNVENLRAPWSMSSYAFLKHPLMCCVCRKTSELQAILFTSKWDKNLLFTNSTKVELYSENNTLKTGATALGIEMPLRWTNVLTHGYPMLGHWSFRPQPRNRRFWH